MLRGLLFDYRTYLFAGLVLIILAPVSEFSHWIIRSTFFAAGAFILFGLSSVLIFLDVFLIAHPELKKKLKKIKFDKKLWKL